MTTDTALIQKREDLKRRLAAGEYKTLVDVVLEWFERLLRKITRRKEPFPRWVVMAILWVILELIKYTGIYVAGDFPTFFMVAEAMKLGLRFGLLFSISADLLFFLILIALNKYTLGFFRIWRVYILDATETLESLQEFENWVYMSRNWLAIFFISLISFLGAGGYGLWITGKVLDINLGYGIIFSTMISSIFTGIILYQFLMIILLSAKLYRYNLTLFVADPGSSEILTRLSGELGFLIYFVAIFASILTLASSWLGLLSSFGIILIIFYWLPIIAMFILNQTSLASIIRRAKWKTLNEIQSQVEELRATGSLKDKETIEAINRLLDFHDRVKATRDSAVDLRTVLNFINSLLLPLLAFILGNLDKVLPLFSRKP